jgi:hypothetical protein
MKQTLKDYGCHFTHIPLLCDNESVIKLANNPVSHSHTKHIDVDSVFWYTKHVLYTLVWI